VNSARSYVRYLVGAIVVFALGLAIGYSQVDDPTFLNSVSKVLLTVGFVAVIVTGTVQLITRVRGSQPAMMPLARRAGAVPAFVVAVVKLTRGGVAVAAITMLTAVGATPASAEPSMIRQEVHFIDPLSPIVSAACGFEVIGTIDATELAIALSDRSGNVFRELNLSHGTETVYAPASGKLLTFPVVMSFHYAYPEGSDVGDQAIVTVDGFVRKLPGAHAEAGQVVYGNGVIVAVDQNGFPRVEFGQPTSVVGNRVAPTEAIATLCAALAP